MIRSGNTAPAPVILFENDGTRQASGPALSVQPFATIIGVFPSP